MTISKDTLEVLKEETGIDLVQEEKKKKESPEKEVYSYIMGMGVELCTDQFGNEAAVYKNKYYEITGKQFRSLVTKNYFEDKEKVFNDSVWKKVQNVLIDICAEKTQSFPIRCYTQNEKIYYDDGKNVWEFNNGEHTVYDKETKECPVIFRRYPHQNVAEVKPNNKSTKEILQSITQNFQIEDFREECIVPLFNSEHPNPMLLFTGDPGAAKSTFTLFIKQLVDPDQIGKLGFPDKKNLQNFAMHRQKFYVVLYDNVREFYQEQSDELCMMITGSASLSRALFTNGDLYISKGLPRILMNGLRPEPSKYNDLLDRTLLIDMLRIENSKPEKEVWRSINDALPELRYCCLRDASKALYKPIESIENLPRMSEFTILAENTSRIWGNEPKSFIDWFTTRMEISHATGMDDPLMIVLDEYMKAFPHLFVGEGCKKTASEWRFSLIDWAEEKDFTIDVYGTRREGQVIRKNLALLVKERDFPGNGVWMGRRFRDLAPLLRSKGFGVEVVRTTEDRSIRLFKK